MPGKDKRRHSRVKPRGVVAHVRSGDRSFACQVENLSAGGLFLRTDVLFPRGSKVEVDLVRDVHVQARSNVQGAVLLDM